MIPLTATNGKQFWVNPTWIVAVNDEDDCTMIEYYDTQRLGVREPAVEVAARINRWYNE